jgi:trehalose 6-phosphate synthase
VSEQGHNFVIVANRLPVDRVHDADGSLRWQRSPGGLVTALAPVMRSRDGAWVGWVGAPDEAPEPFESGGISLRAVPVSASEITDYYEGFSNASLWPLYHDVIVPAEFHREWWDAYRTVNQRFARETALAAAHGATVWIQDYQLQLVPAMLREARPDLRIGFFLHIPFPPTELFAQLPWRRQILEGLLGADLVGFQREGAAANFMQLATRFTDARAFDDRRVTFGERVVRAEAFPISIEIEEVDSLARDPEVAERAAQIRAELGDPDRVLLGVDRLDYTKGIAHRLKAWGELLAEGAVSAQQAAMIQVATPSRERVEAYMALRDDIELTVGRLNGEWSQMGQPAVNYMHTTFDRRELVAMLRAADVAVVTPLRDGMNLVAKEFIAARVEDDGVLMLSEFAGAADQLTDALLVNPHDIDGLKRDFLTALSMPIEEQRERMRSLRRQVASYDVNRWAQEFLQALGIEPPS